MTTAVGPSRAEVAAARSAASGRVIETPLLDGGWLSERVGGRVAFKAENLQRTGSFKVRGATAKIDRLSAREMEAGVVAASAGNHGQAIAYAASAKEVPCRVFMPAGASLSKLEAVRGRGGVVEDGGGSVDECVVQAREFAAEHGAVFVHPFDDPEVLIGQGTLALELLEQDGGASVLIIPVGGGGLAGSVACVAKELRPGVRVVGVQVKGCDPLVTADADQDAAAVHLADGIAIKQPGELTRPLVERYVDEMCSVSEDEIAEAMVLLMQRSKLVTEGAGAAGIAALLSGQVVPDSHGRTVAVLSGGNVDVGVLSTVARRYEFEAGRRLHLLTRVPDRPGGLAALLEVVAGAGANVLAAEHLRDALPLHVGETGLELVLETRGEEHSATVTSMLREANYPLEDSTHPRLR